jgi:hypothetical protein
LHTGSDTQQPLLLQFAFPEVEQKRAQHSSLLLVTN